jgi:hypothetical protein
MSKLRIKVAKATVSRTLEGAKNLLAGIGIAAITVGSTYIPYLINNVNNNIKPSQQRQSFETRYGVELEGWKRDLEDDKRTIANIANVFEKEMLQKPFKVNKIIMRSDKLHLRTLDDAASDYLFPHAGYAMPVINNILIEPRSYDVLHHEIKHIKTYEMLKNHPEFRIEWEKLTTGPDGNSYYMGHSKEALSRFRFTSDWINRKSADELLHLGFVSEYAATNFLEDVAETGEFIEDGNTYRIQGIRQLIKNGVIDAKIKLLEKYELIPREFSEYARLDVMYSRTISGGGPGSWSIDLPKVFDFMQESNDFLQKHKGSVYEEKIRLNRAFAMQRAALSWKPDKLPKGDLQSMPEYWHYAVTLNDAIDEHLQVLETNYHEYGYVSSMDQLRDLYYLTGQRDKFDVMVEAHFRYMERIQDGTIGLPSIGVNDFLKEKGILK